MSGQGFILLYRRIWECWIWEDANDLKRWIDLLMLANHSDKKIKFDGELITISRGQYLTSIRKLADRWGCTTKTVRRFLELLESDSMILRKSTPRATLINIVNYEVYQGFTDEKGTVSNTLSNTVSTLPSPHSVPTNNNDKECIKNDKKNNKATAKQFVSDGYLQSWIEAFIDHRKKLKKPMTDKAIELFINKLNKLCPDNIDGQVQLIQTAIERGWQTVYPNDEQTLTKKQEKNDSKLKALENYYMQEE